jgi:RNA polymerase sigma-32 factor
LPGATATPSTDAPEKAENGGQAAGPARAPRRARAASRAQRSSEPPESAGPESRDGGAGSNDGDDDESSSNSDETEPVADASAELVEDTDEPSFGDEEDPFTQRRSSNEASDDEPASSHGNSSSAHAAEAAKLALGRQDPLQAYLREVQKHHLLTPDEEHSLAVKYAGTQDVGAAARLVTANLRLVVKIAYEYRRAYKNIMDLIQEGNIGLMQAVKKYDPHRGVKLSSYSAWWIRAYILRYIINNWRLVKLGTTQAQRKLFFNLNKEKAKLAAMGIDPTPGEIAKRLGVEEQEAIDMDRRLSSGEMSLDAPVGDNEGRPVARIELLPSTMLGPDVMVADEELGDIVREKLAEFRTTLKGKDVAIFEQRLMADEPKTLQELGDQFGISRERVRQIEARLTMNLRTFLRDALGDAVSNN